MKQIKVKVVRPSNKEHYQLRWRDPVTGRSRQETTRTTSKSDAIKLAGRKEEELTRNPHAGRRLLWEELCRRYEADQRLALSPQTIAIFRDAKKKVATLIAPVQVEQVNALALSEMAHALRSKGRSPETIRKVFRHLKAMFNWAKGVGLIEEVPRFPKISSRGRSMMARSRPVTGEEFDRVLAAVKTARPHDSKTWVRFLKGLAYSGLRIGELYRLRWDAGEGIFVDSNGPIPVIRIRSSAHKGGGDKIQIITPEFWNLIKPARKEGYVFRVDSLTTGDRLRCHRVGKIIAEIGEKAGVLTSPEDKKHATSHDLGRRFFTVRIQQQLSMMETAKVMRHASAQTTMAYYYQPEMMALAQKLWSPGDFQGDLAPAESGDQ